MKRTNEEILDVFADILEPAYAIITDKDWAGLWLSGDRIGAIRAAIKTHTREITEILACFEGQDPETYRIDPVSLFIRVASAFNRPDLEEYTDSLFTSRAQSGESAPSGPATPNTAAGGR